MGDEFADGQLLGIQSGPLSDGGRPHSGRGRSGGAGRGSEGQSMPLPPNPTTRLGGLAELDRALRT